MPIETPSKASDRRRGARVPLRVHVQYESLDEFLDDYTSNLSIGGMFIARQRPLDAGTRFRLVFQVPGRAQPVTTMGTVKWVIQPGQGMTPGMGVEFDKLGLADVRLVQRWLRNANIGGI